MEKQNDYVKQNALIHAIIRAGVHSSLSWTQQNPTIHVKLSFDKWFYFLIFSGSFYLLLPIPKSEELLFYMNMHTSLESLKI